MKLNFVRPRVNRRAELCLQILYRINENSGSALGLHLEMSIRVKWKRLCKDALDWTATFHDHGSSSDVEDVQLAVPSLWP